jgi:hypothetical protein
MSNPNLIPNPSFASGLDGWSAQGSITLSISNRYFYTGNESLRAVNSNTSLVTPAIFTSPINRINVKSSTTYTASAYILEKTAPATASVEVDLYDSYGTKTAASAISGGNDTLATTTGNDWERASFTFNTLSSTVSVVVRVAYSYIGEDDDFYVDSVRLEEGAIPSDIIEVRTQDQKNKLTARALQPEFIDHLKGMKLKADIILNNMVFNTIDEYGVVWVITNVTGWNQLPEIEVQDFPRGFGDGSYLGLGRYAARIINIEGVFLTQDAATQLSDARDRLFTALNMVKKDGLLIMKEDVAKSARVRLSGTPEIETENSRGRTRFSFGLTAGDPIKYAVDLINPGLYTTNTISANAQVAIINSGNTPVPVKFSLNGPTTGSFSITNITNSERLTSSYKVKDTKQANVGSTRILDNLLEIATGSYTGLVAGDTVELINVPDVFEMAIALVRYNNGTFLVKTKTNHHLAAGQKVRFRDVTNSSGGGVVIADDTIGTITSVSGLDSFVVSTGHASGAATFELNDTAKCLVYSEPSYAEYSAVDKSATITTADAHGLIVGQTVVMQGFGIPYNGTHLVTEIISSYIFKVSIPESRVWSTIASYSCTAGLATIGFSTDPKVVVGDKITVFGINSDLNGEAPVASISGSGPYYVSYNVSNVDDIASTNVSVSGRAIMYISSISNRVSAAVSSCKVYYGEIMNGTYEIDSISSNSTSLYVAKNLSYDLTSTSYSSWVSGFLPQVRLRNENIGIDTYTKEISVNNDASGNRSKVDVLVDWIQLDPGTNLIYFEDKNPKYVSSKRLLSNFGYLTTFADHGFIVGTVFTVSGIDGTFNGGPRTVTEIVSPREIKFALTGTNVSLTSTTSGYIQEVSTATLDIYYRSGWIN